LLVSLFESYDDAQTCVHQKSTYISCVNSEIHYTQLLLGQSVLTGICVIYL